jgi:hypothetical protein
MAGKALIDDTKEGLSAIGWKDYLVFDDASNKLEIAGNVTAVHRPNGKDDAPLQVNCPRVLATLSDDEKAGHKTLKNVHIDGGMSLRENGDLRFEAWQVDYDPKTSQAIATAKPGTPGKVYDSKTPSGGSFQKLFYNVKEKQIERVEGIDANLVR